MRVIVAEKPSVARDLARVLGASSKQDGYLEGNGLRITWCFGHMVELEEPAHYDARWKRWALDTLPMVPERFEVRARKGGSKEQLAVLRRLLRDRSVEVVINACDAGREGELIFRYVYQHTGCTHPILRLWISSLTDEAIKDGWARLRPGADFDHLEAAARCRAEADWLVGLNATRALTCRGRAVGGDGVLSVGRVQTPTLAMIVARDLEIDAFVPETFWQVEAQLFAPEVGGPPDRWKATWIRARSDDDDRRSKGSDGESDDEVPRAERITDQATAEAIAAAAHGQEGRVAVARRKRTRERPPLLYDLTSLQRRANQRYGLSAQRTLEIAQELYEKHKLITYPRTDARFITPDQVPLLPDILRGLLPIGPYAPFVQALLAGPIQPGKRVVDASEVGDHHAILPTGRTPSARLSADEKRIFDLVARRLLAALSDEALFDVTELIVEVPPGASLPDDVPSPLAFRARGRVCRQQGWRAVDPPGKSKDVELPAVEVGDPAQVEESAVQEGQTRPPRPYSDATILRGMETAGRTLDDEELARTMRSRGLGTPATRAAILQTLIDRKYVVRDKRSLKATDRGRAVIAALPVEELKSAELTGRWEGRLTDVAEGKEARPRFMADVGDNVREIVDAIAAAEPPEVEAVQRPEGKVLGDCPACGQPVRDKGRVFACDADQACAFVVFKTMSKRKISATMVKQLLAEGRSPAVKGFKSKKGKDFVAGLVWDAEQKRVGFWFPERDTGETGGETRGAAAPSGPGAAAGPERRGRSEARNGAAGRARSSGDPTGERCPDCGRGTIIRGRAAWGCDRWRDGCGWRRPFDATV